MASTSVTTNTNNPAFNLDPTYFTRGFSKSSRIPKFSANDLPPLSIFHDAQTRIARRTTSFVPRHIESCLLAAVFFSGANLSWLQNRILSRINEVVGQNVSMGAPDPTNLKIIMEQEWEKAYMTGDLSDSRTVHQNLALLDKYVTEKCVNAIILGVEEQLDYVIKSTRGAQYDDPWLKTISVGDGKLSTSGGTLNTSSIVLGNSSNTTVASKSNSYYQFPSADWDAVAAEDTAFQSTTGFRANLNALPSL